MRRHGRRTARAGSPIRVSAALAVTAVLLQLSATLGGAIHFALVLHEHCPAHGELVHGRGASHAAGPAARPNAALSRSGSSDELARASGADPHETQDSHDVCPIVALARQRYHASTAASAPTVLDVTAAPSPGAARPVAGAKLAAYRLAPKTSPPVSAAA